MRQIQFSEGSIFRNILRSALPMLAAQIINLLYNIVDRIYIGRIPGEGTVALGAAGLCFSVIIFISAFTNMYGSGGAPLCSIERGRGRRAKAEEVMNVSCFLLVSTGLFITAAGELAAEPVLRLLGASDTNLVFALPYLRIYLLGTIFSMLATGLNPYINAQGFAGAGMFTVVIGAVCNLLLDPVFIFALGLEIRGAAIATILGNAAGMCVSLWFYLSGKTLLSPSLKYVRPTAEILREIFWVGVPATLETLLTSAAYIVNNNLAVGYGELTVAAMGIAQKILSLGNYVYQGFAAGTQPIMGYNYGAKNYRRMIDVLKAGVMVCSGTELCIMAVYGIFAPQLIGIFTDSAEVIATGSRVLRTIMWILPFVGAVSMSRMSFQAMGKPQYAFAITLVRQLFLYVPLLLVLNRVFGFGGMIWAQPVTEFIMMTVSLTLLYRVIRGQEAAMSGRV